MSEKDRISGIFDQLMASFGQVVDNVENFFTFLFAPFAIPFLPGQRIYIVYLLSAVALAFVVYMVSHRQRGENVFKSFVRYCFDRRILFHKSARVDYKYFIVNKIFYTVFLAPLVVGSALFSGWVAEFLKYVTGLEGPVLVPGIMANLAITVVSLVFLDLAVFIAHYLMHRVPFLWEFHKVHHSAEVLTPITLYRMHPVDEILSGCMVGLFVGVSYGVFEFLYAGLPDTVSILELNVFIFVFYLLGYNLRHSHIWLSYPRLISHIFVSPAQHQIHHSSAAIHFDKNLGLIFAFWDYFCGTLYVPETREDLVFGLPDGEQKEYDGVLRLYLLPIRKNWRRLFGGSASRTDEPAV